MPAHITQIAPVQQPASDGTESILISLEVLAGIIAHLIQKIYISKFTKHLQVFDKSAL